MSSIKWKNDQVVAKPVKSQFQCPIIESITFYIEQGFSKQEIIELGQEEGLTNKDLMQAFDSLNKEFMF